LRGLRGLFITTNIDEHFDKKFHSSRIITHKDGFDPSDIVDSKLYHIHGSIADWSTVIITVKDYFERYNDDRFKFFLQKIFEEKTVLFVGYGMNEFEVLDFLITKSVKSLSTSPKHFILLPYYRGEDNILEFEEHYFLQMGISVIPYMKDEKGYGQLFDVIKNWNREIILQSDFLDDNYEKLKNAANNYTPLIEVEIFQLIKNEKNLEFEFFRQLSKSQNPVPWFQPLIHNGFFTPQNNPSTTEGFGSYWNVMAVLEKIAKLNLINPVEEITKKIIGIIDPIIDYRDEKKGRIENNLTDRHIVRIIFLLPLDSISTNHLNFIDICLHSYHEQVLLVSEFEEMVIPRLLENKNNELLLKILALILGFEKSEIPTFEEYYSILGRYYLQIVLEKFTEKIIKNCGMSAIDIAINKIEIIVGEDPSQFNKVWLSSINNRNEEDNEFEVKERYDVQLTHFIWNGFKILGPIQIRNRVTELLSKGHPIFKRIAICSIDEYYIELNDLFWKLDRNPLDENGLEHELFELLNHHCKEFSDEQINIVIEWIETRSYYEDDQEEYLAYKKKEWLSALLPTDNQQVGILFAKYQSINPAELHHPGQRITFEHFPDSTSQISKEDLLDKPNGEIVHYLNHFNDDEHTFGKISTHLLGEVFRACVIENPQKFVQDLGPFLDLKRMYQYELFLGLSEAWRKENNFNWTNIFRFINSIIKPDEFWIEVCIDGEFNYRDWIISQIAGLIEEGTKNKSHTFGLELLPEAEKILLHLAQKTESDLSDGGDLVTSVVNSNKGRIYSAILSYSWCFARQNPQNTEILWPEKIRDEFEKRLDPSIEPSVEFSVTLGEYLPYLCSLDKEWVLNNINRIFPLDNEIHWNAAFTAYLFYSKVYKKIYDLLKENGHYSKAIITKFKDPHINENLVHHICIGYLEGFENIDNEHSLIFQLLKVWNIEQIIELIRYLKWNSRRLTPEKRQMILPLWEKINSKIAPEEKNSDNIRILSELNNWICIIDDLSDELCERLKISAKYVKSHEFKFIEELIRHSVSKPRCAGEIYLSMIEAGNYFDYQQENIIKFVSILYEKGEKKIADVICNHYLNVGFDFLRPIYEQYKDK